jgi:hypothetical protein
MKLMAKGPPGSPTACAAIAPFVLSFAAACGGGGESSTFVVDAGDGSVNGFVLTDASGSGADGNTTHTDFPSTPVLDAPDGGVSAPSSAAQLFGPPSQGAQTGGPCLIEPEIGSLYPKNWLRPRFRWVAPGGENLFEIRLHAANQTNDLVVYTAATEWTMPVAMWDLLRADSDDVPMTVSVRGGVLAGATLSGESLGSTGSIGIAPVEAPGTIVYWTPTPDTALKGFAIGDESVTPVLVPGQVTEYTTGCIGCHNSTPDGQFASFTSSTNNWQNGLANIQAGMTGAVPPWFGAAGQAAVETTNMGIHTFSAAHWTTGDRIEISVHDPVDNGMAELVWVDTEAQTAPAMGILARTGDPNFAGAPSWSHDGTTIAYVSTNANEDGRLSDGEADVYLIPYADKAGGNAKPLQGAATAGPREYYPTWSPDDAIIAFDKASSGSMYNNSLAEVYVVPSSGSAAGPTRLAANDPPACSNQSSPGVTNSWPKWAPSVGAASGGRTFYWLVFSSTRDPYSGNTPQLYVTGIVTQGGQTTTYAALYLWNQPEDEHNHTPAWDYFKIPQPPPQ